MPITITRRFEFDYGHRVLGHEGKCRHLHGHRGVAEVTVQAQELDRLGRVVDFSVLKEKVGGWIDDHWDHRYLCHRADPLAQAWQEYEDSQGTSKRGVWAFDALGGAAPYVMHLAGVNANPTAENIAAELYYHATGLLRGHDLVVTHVRVYETPNCHADYAPND